MRVVEAKQAKLDHNSNGKHADKQVSLFRFLLDSEMPESELSENRLAKEAQIILAAATTTTGRAISLISYYILANPPIHKRLEEDLRETMATYPTRVPLWSELERLPYLQALVKEGLR